MAAPAREADAVPADLEPPRGRELAYRGAQFGERGGQGVPGPGPAGRRAAARVDAPGSSVSISPSQTFWQFESLTG
jgi:hypothetical protein